MQPLKTYSSLQFGLFRIALGFYLLACAGMEWKLRYVFYGNEGVLPLSYLPYMMPPILSGFYEQIWNNATLDGLCAGRLVLIAMLLLGAYRRPVALLLFLINIVMSNRNIATTTPEVTYLNWLILACAVVPAGERFSLSRERRDWFMPAMLYYGGWFVLALSYFYSACTKWSHPRWRAGLALRDFVTDGTAARAWIYNYANGAALLWVFTAAAYFTLAIEFGGLFALFGRQSRFIWWLGSGLMLIGAMAVFSLTQICLGLLLFHFFLWDRRWLASTR